MTLKKVKELSLKLSIWEKELEEAPDNIVEAFTILKISVDNELNKARM